MVSSLAQVWLLPTIAYAAVVGFQEYRRGHPQAQLSTSLFFLATCLFDIAADQDWIRGPRMIPVGMAAMIFSMATSLANRLTQANREVDALTAKNRELQEAKESMREASLTDPLTGLRNRRCARLLLSPGGCSGCWASPHRSGFGLRVERGRRGTLTRRDGGCGLAVPQSLPGVSSALPMGRVLSLCRGLLCR